MLESIRNRSNGPVAKFIIGLIIVPFAFAGVYSYMNVNTSNSVATVNGDEISLMEFDRSYRLQQQNWGENFDKYFNTDERLQQFRLNVLQQLINKRLSSQAIGDMGLRTSDNQLRQVIINTVEFHNEEGVFDKDRYQMLLQSNGYTKQLYQNDRKSDMAANQFMSALQESNFVLKSELALNTRLENQTRDIDYLIIPQDYYLQQVDLSGEEGEQAISSYYEMNKSRFAIPEKVSIEYIYITKSSGANITISDGQIAEYYEDNISNFESTERRKVAHILVAVDIDADQSTVGIAESKINNFASRIQAGESFEEIAKQGSEDTMSAESGGDLDWIEAGMMDEAFENAAFSLQEAGSISKVVKTDFGFHLIKLLEIESGEAKPVEELKEQITSILQEQIVEDKYFDLKDIIREKVFEVSDSLSEAADENSLTVRKSGFFDRQFGIGLPVELQNQPNLIDIAFSDDVLYQGMNSELIELSDGNAVVLRLLEHQESGTTPLADVNEEITTLLTQQQARDAIELQGNEIITALEEGQSADDVMTILPEGVPATWKQQLALGRKGTEVDAQLRDKVFKIHAPSENSAVFKGVLLSSGDFAVIKLSTVTEGAIADPEGSEDNKMSEQFNRFHTQAELYNYLKYLDGKASISRTIANADQVQ
ncbi:MAG: hypothetical protein GY829_08410 [Gammaproteobacteria bacterium]|nr:hypothetical protein [Gammaproteobacteria bacterium]